MCHPPGMIWRPLLCSLLVVLGVVEIQSMSVEDRLVGSGEDVGVGARQLSPQEEGLVNKARADVAKAIENNLAKIFAIAVAENEEMPYLRQDYDDDVIVTPNPNILPQVAQILGAIFSGSLNITRIVDSTVGLVPNVVRNQLEGLVKVLTGENINLSGTTTIVPTPPPQPNFEAVTSPSGSFSGPDLVPVVVQKAHSVVVESIGEVDEVTVKSKYQVAKNRTRRPTTTPAPFIVIDDEVDRIERELRVAARQYEPYAAEKEPRIYAGMFSNVLSAVNMTEVAKAVPTIFKGAKDAMLMLEKMGVLDSLPGADILDDLDLD